MRGLKCAAWHQYVFFINKYYLHTLQLQLMIPFPFPHLQCDNCNYSDDVDLAPVGESDSLSNVNPAEAYLLIGLVVQR